MQKKGNEVVMGIFGESVFNFAATKKVMLGMSPYVGLLLELTKLNLVKCATLVGGRCDDLLV